MKATLEQVTMKVFPICLDFLKNKLSDSEFLKHFFGTIRACGWGEFEYLDARHADAPEFVDRVKTACAKHIFN